jgi:hypothetical protein
MAINQITEEIRRTRHQLAAACGNDVFRIGAELRKRESESGRRIVRLPKREPATITTNKAMHPSGRGSVSGNGDSSPAAG